MIYETRCYQIATSNSHRAGQLERERSHAATIAVASAAANGCA